MHSKTRNLHAFGALRSDYHSFLSYSVTATSKNDEIWIVVRNADSLTLPYESYIYVERKVNILTDVVPALRDKTITYSGNRGLFTLVTENTTILSAPRKNRIRSFRRRRWWHGCDLVTRRWRTGRGPMGWQWPWKIRQSRYRWRGDSKGECISAVGWWPWN